MDWEGEPAKAGAADSVGGYGEILSRGASRDGQGHLRQPAYFR